MLDKQNDPVATVLELYAKRTKLEEQKFELPYEQRFDKTSKYYQIENEINVVNGKITEVCKDPNANLAILQLDMWARGEQYNTTLRFYEDKYGKGSYGLEYGVPDWQKPKHDALSQHSSDEHFLAAIEPSRKRLEEAEAKYDQFEKVCDVSRAEKAQVWKRVAEWNLQQKQSKENQQQAKKNRKAEQQDEITSTNKNEQSEIKNESKTKSIGGVHAWRKMGEIYTFKFLSNVSENEMQNALDRVGAKKYEEKKDGYSVDFGYGDVNFHSKTNKVEITNLSRENFSKIAAFSADCKVSGFDLSILDKELIEKKDPKREEILYNAYAGIKDGGGTNVNVTGLDGVLLKNFEDKYNYENTARFTAK